jgi:hypothetical protein
MAILPSIILAITIQFIPLPARRSQNPPVSAMCQQITSHKTDRTYSYFQQEIPWWEDAGRATWALVAVGIAGSALAFWTLLSIKGQTDALIKSERAWITVEVQCTPGAGPWFDTWEQGTEQVVAHVAHRSIFHARIMCKNDGKAPAWIEQKQACIDVFDSLPENPDWSNLALVQCEPEPIRVGESGDAIDCSLTCNKREEVGQITIIYGLIRYRDPFGDNRSTSFAYRVLPDRISIERLSGYPKYNEYK